MRRLFTCFITAILYCFIFADLANAIDVSFSWLPNSESDLAGYKIHYGSTSGQYDQVVDCNLPETVDGRVHYTIHDAPATLTYFAATAYDTDGNESDYSNELSLNPAPAAPQDFKSITITVNVQVQ